MIGAGTTNGSIIGRADDVRSVLALLEGSRLVTLLGPGGVGKTSLAAELALEVEPEVSRVLTVELAETDHHGDVLRLLAAAVFDESDLDADRLATALDAAPTLLVVDNCEHVVDSAAAVLASILARTQSTKILATSRRPLQIGPEVLWEVAPLPLPSSAESDQDLIVSPAVQLFLERVHQAVPTFELTAANRPSVAAICTATDGLPLALELAAALVRTQPLDGILRAMTEQPTSVTSARRDVPGHQRSIGASVDWSRRFLSDADSDLLDQLSVFVGGFTADAAQAVALDGAEGISRLVDHSLVTFDPVTDRYRILEVIRLEAVSRLSDADRRLVNQRHLAWCQRVVADIDDARFAPDPHNRFPRFERELPNLCAAIRRCRDADDLDGFRSLLGPIALWWVHYLPPDDPDEWGTAFDDTAPTSWRGNVQSALAFYWSHRGDHERALALAEQARTLHAQDSDVINRLMDELAVANALVALGRTDEARAVLQAALHSASGTGEAYPELVVRVGLARLDPDDHHADRHLTDALAIAEQGFAALEAVIRSELALRASRDGRTADATRLAHQAVDLARTNGYSEAFGTALCAQGEVARASGNQHLAATAFTEALGIARQTSHAGVTARAEAGLASLDARATVAASEPPPGTEALSERELAVARLLRGDLTQREIADELYIAPSTVKTHIKSIYRKLGVGKRSHAVTRAAELGLFG